MDNTNEQVTQADLGQLLKHMRIDAGLSQAAAAKKINRRPTSVQRLEEGTTGLTVDVWLSAFQAYGGEIKVRGNPPTMILAPGGVR